MLKKVALAEVKARLTCQVKSESWNGLTCQVSSSTRTGVWYAIDLRDPKQPGKLCSNGCMLSRVGFCPHVVAALMEQPSLMYVNYLPAWQTLVGWGFQLGVEYESSLEDDLKFTLPTENEVEAIMNEDSTLNKTALPPSSRGTASKNVGRIVGTVEEVLRRDKRLAKEIADGKIPGVPGIAGTTPVRARPELAPSHTSQC